MGGNGLHCFSNSRQGILYQLDYRYWKINQPKDGSAWFACDRCGGIYPESIKGVCPTFSCDGELKQMSVQDNDEIKENHYRFLYSNLLPVKLTAREHTAQLTSDFASNIQQKFIKSGIDVLSCSTTFELGVDLGDLEAIFLRNVPPGPSNYVQRVGRAGRRLETIGFALTFAQLRSHDLTYFKNPEKMIDGKIDPPTVELRNEKIISRHLHSVVLADFFRKHNDYFGTVESFFKLEEQSTTGPQKIKKYLDTKPQSIMHSLRRIIPEHLSHNFNIEKWGWVDNLIGKDGTLILADEKVRDEFAYLTSFYDSKEEEWKNTREQARKNKLNADMNWADRRLKTISKRHLIDFLATHTVIPKYGFPVDVIELAVLSHTPAAKNIQLERDLRIAISEFAPGSQVVANGYIWQSAGLKVVRNRTWPI